MEIIDFYKKMRTGSLICLLGRICLCVSIERGKPSVYFLLNIGYPLCPSRRIPSSSSSSSSSVRPSRRPSCRRPSSVRPSRRPSIRRVAYVVIVQFYLFEIGFGIGFEFGTLLQGDHDLSFFRACLERVCHIVNEELYENDICIYVYTYTYIHIYIYIYRQRGSYERKETKVRVVN